MTNIRVTAFQWVPPFAQGLVRDLPVRWALEEAGMEYQEALLAPGEQNAAANRALQPFGKVPAYVEDGIAMFESGAIVLHIAEQHDLLPADPAARARAKSWIFAALNSIDPYIRLLDEIDQFHAREAAGAARRTTIVDALRQRLEVVASELAQREYLAGEFSAADIMMVHILRQLRNTTLVEEIPALAAWRTRCEQRPAFARALGAQMAAFARFKPAA